MKIFTISDSRQHSLSTKCQSLLIYIFPNNLPNREVWFIGSWLKKLPIQKLRCVLKVTDTVYIYAKYPSCTQILMNIFSNNSVRICDYNF